MLAPTDLARVLGFTTGGVTTVLDRLERAGYVQRRPGSGDRRRLLVETTAATAARDAEVFGNLIRQTSDLLASYTDQQLQVIDDFLTRIRQLTAAYDACAVGTGAVRDPENPSEVDVAQPSDALTAQADTAGAFNNLFLGLGAVALLVGAVGVANIMVISVLERRSEIGLRRALGATRGQIRIQFLAEAILLSLAGGVVGLAAGATTTAVYARVHGEAIVIPPGAWVGGLAATLLIGTAAGLLPAIRAARLSPTQALWSI